MTSVDGTGSQNSGAADVIGAPLDLLTYQFIKRRLHGAKTLCRVAIMGKTDKDVRMSLQTLRVLEAFLENPTQELAGADVQKRGKLASGTLYPILLRLEAAGWFVSRWESVDPVHVGRPRRRLYRLTPSGLARASEVFASFGRGVTA
jgi:PadR family transcriptional regulator, regulatory protein PadR